MKRLLYGLAWHVLACLTLSINAAPLGSAFTYQGRLTDSGSGPSGVFDFEFRLFNAAAAGGQIGVTVALDDVAVSNGLFTVALDFGGSAFNGDARWLAIGVRYGTNTGAYTTLTPRQPLTPTPYALFASNSVVAATVSSGGVTGTSIANGTITSADLSVPLLSNTFWLVNGNLNTTPGTHFLGTLDNRALVLRVNNTPGFRLEYGRGFPNVIGGISNSIHVNAAAATIAGGYGNEVTDNQDGATIGGGIENEAHSFASTIAGGADNRASHDRATIAGGQANSARGDSSFVGGGFGNDSANGGTVIAGGFYNTNLALYASIGGGTMNHVTVPGQMAVIGGGSNNVVTVPNAVIGGGGNNRVTSVFSNIGGGSSNLIGTNTESTTIAGGFANRIAEAGVATIGGGAQNEISNAGYFTTIAGGGHNTIAGVAQGSTISGGEMNTIHGDNLYSTIAGGSQNLIETNARFGVISGGTDNRVEMGSDYGTILGGARNSVGRDAPFSAAAGFRAKANHRGSFVWADDTDADFASTTNKQFAVRANNGVMVTATHMALDLRGGGALRVAGSGVNTATPVFTHRVTAASIPAGLAHVSLIDHPHANGNADVILIITHNYTKDTAPSRYETTPVGVYYNGTESKWAIYHEDTVVAMPVGRAFNVIVIKP